MKHFRSGFVVAGLLLAAGCGSVGYSGPDLYVFNDGYADSTPQYGSKGIHVSVPCYPRAPYVLAGFTGPAGPSGGPGVGGRTGLSGSAGRQGSAGLQGPAGMQGPMGWSGVTGSDGVQGPPGLTGPGGAQGPMGAQGPEGLQGPVGTQGPAGAAGRVGPRTDLRGPFGLWASMDNVNFEFESAGIQPKCAEKIAKLATWMNENPPVVIALDGHATEGWVNENDPALNERRVQAVRGALIAAGVAPDRISTGTFGARGPVCLDYSIETCRELNRRVEILASRQ